MQNLSRVLFFGVLVFSFVNLINSEGKSCSKTKKAMKKTMTKSYKYYADEVNWLEASISCLSKCGELAVIESEKEHKAAFKRLDDKPVKEGTWIGLIFNKNLYWQNGKPGVSKSGLPFASFTETNSLPSEVGCFGLKNTGFGYEGRKWVVGRCFVKKPYLCQFLKEKQEKKVKEDTQTTEEEINTDAIPTIAKFNKTMNFDGKSQINFWSPMFFFPMVPRKDEPAKK